MIPFPAIDPVAVTIPLPGGAGLPIRWYALAYLAGLAGGWWLMARLMRREGLWGDGAPMRPGQVEELLTWVVAGVVLGGRLGFVLFYQPGYYLANPLDILKVWQGGMSFHGGFLGVLLATLLWCRRTGIEALRVIDAIAVVSPLGLFFGRLANFINAELWGRPTDAPWGVVFPGPAAQDCPGVEGLCARHPSQLYEAGLEGLLLGLVMWLLVRRGGLARPGLAGAVFLAGYGIARFFVEFFREADAQFITPENPLGHVIGGPVWGASMGQLLSLPMIVVGLLVAWWALRRPVRG
ncbi:prolipoprotein diacylglyceryl transferase [Paracoccus sp. S-4012]|uniref:prolipoprotein diacylglyceryl transferase n=1 Tax=Paracoccus sp. S-4012 TaxID=2665648 RepID=UPI0012AF7F63|nr:prolipoprotein diacylglyceryl transferase [Paracoccus sp. S-4012]MRX50317.1 prolipoprotein diacylglyceryl transferase [Paracoccus sp. S-4012]